MFFLVLEDLSRPLPEEERAGVLFPQTVLDLLYMPHAKPFASELAFPLLFHNEQLQA